MRRSKCVVLALAGWVGLTSWIACASPDLDASIGLSSCVVARLYAPVYVTLSGLAADTKGTVRVVQRIGDASQSPDVVINDIAEGPLTNGQIVSTIPIYDPLNPVDVLLLNENGETVARKELNLRLFTRPAAFPVVCGEAMALGGAEARVSAAELPLDWWAYESADSVWLAGESVSTDAWDALERWVLAGGSLVVFTGSDYYRIDSPSLRRMLPANDVDLVTEEDGLQHLAIESTSGVAMATVETADMPFTLAFQCSYGAGTVTVVTIRAEDLPADDVAVLGQRVPGARILSLVPYGKTYHGEIRVPRPPYFVAPLVVGVLLGAACWLRFTGGREELRRRAGTLTAWVFSGVAIVGLSVFSGLYTNQTKQLVELYQCDITINVQAAVGISIGYVGFFAYASPLNVDMPREGAGVPAHSLLNTVAQPTFSSHTTPASYDFTLQASEFREMRVFGAPRQLVSFQTDAAVTHLEITNHAAENVVVGALLDDGIMYRLGRVGVGDQSVNLPVGESAQSIWAIKGYGQMLQEVMREYGLERGQWLILVSDATDLEPGTHVPRKVRHVDVYVVAAEGVNS